MIAAIDWGQIFELIWASAVAGIAVAVTFAVLIVGATRASDHRRADRGGVAAAYIVLAGIAAVVFAGGVVLGISIIVSK
ncbi:MAG TPA: hypothetical protein VKB54_21760 [Solirubrobacteraceae bacterium]|jgi:hypothetical protein|nr:hypothetical protein [Solirubrobacteraceae bacterium]